MTRPVKPPELLRLASYNVQKCVGLDMRRLPRRILQVLSGISADIVVLQEADKRLPPRPAALPHFVLDEAGWEIADFGGAGSLGWHGNAVIWRSNRGLELIEMHHITLPGLEPRGAIRAEFATAQGPLRVVGLHLGLIGRHRFQQVHHLAEHCAALPSMPTVWAGDFNEWSRLPNIDRMAPKMRFLPPLPSFPAPRPMGSLDRIALGGGLRAVSHGVWQERPAQIASDHLPVWADLELPLQSDAKEKGSDSTDPFL
ncbi:endonuclease/exonuclease/phosphatase family protein [Pontibaca salina]|uniref:Endonuclease/exonuclease/phosphatase family protein n=1 Tax=Pontibaca salina TaxID=2795731 RepID=A0A934HUI7_9RHOB|nr:endonuclease/exonuclease/phosphatase family protein [Pontibaca salina]MBI6629799.1 endonuclease/exonuclease/phosphatase family protein [Pontibaca salina]